MPHDLRRKSFIEEKTTWKEEQKSLAVYNMLPIMR